jgi:hypothetical protein
MKRLCIIITEKKAGTQSMLTWTDGWFRGAKPAWPDGRKEAISSFLLSRWHTNQATSARSAGVLFGGRVQVWRCHNLQALLLLESASVAYSMSVMVARNLECKIAPMTPNRNISYLHPNDFDHPVAVFLYNPPF